MPNAEFRRQERVDEGNIVVDAADLEDFLPPQAELLVPVAPLVQVVALVVLLAERPVFQRCSMSRSSSMPSL